MNVDHTFFKSSQPFTAPFRHYFDDDYQPVLSSSLHALQPLTWREEAAPSFERLDLELGLDMGESREKLETMAVAVEDHKEPVPCCVQDEYTMDEQLDFIMKTMKKQKRQKRKGYTKNRKTPEQLKILTKELGEAKSTSKKKDRSGGCKDRT
eukprot:TRINITY_DN10601_c0_g3_i3.p1 TRINITY_DN10601_c0_g3~~TRINITY_DN10601_c0_g3_i3.p1  ORF type:complete len:152 (-),score=29.87 TRINITY_DN10601_c0_g3_i3:190-645(-)